MRKKCRTLILIVLLSHTTTVSAWSLDFNFDSLKAFSKPSSFAEVSNMTKGFSYDSFYSLSSAVNTASQASKAWSIGSFFSDIGKSVTQNLGKTLANTITNGLTNAASTAIQKALGLYKEPNITTATEFAVPSWWTLGNTTSTNSNITNPLQSNLAEKVATNSDNTSVWIGTDGQYYKVDANGNPMRKLTDFEKEALLGATGSGTGTNTNTNAGLDTNSDWYRPGMESVLTDAELADILKNGPPSGMTLDQYLAWANERAEQTGKNPGGSLGSWLTGDGGSTNGSTTPGTTAPPTTIVNVGGVGAGNILMNPGATAGMPVVLDNAMVGDLNPQTGKWSLTDAEGKKIDVDFDLEHGKTIDFSKPITVEGKVAIDAITGKPYIYAEAINGSPKPVATQSPDIQLADYALQPVELPPSQPIYASTLDAAAGATSAVLNMIGFQNSDGPTIAANGLFASIKERVVPTANPADRNEPRVRVTRDGVPMRSDATAIGADPREVMHSLATGQLEATPDIISTRFKSLPTKGDKDLSALTSAKDAWGEIVP